VLIGIIAALTAWLWPHLARPPTRFEVARQLLQQGRPADAAQLLEDPIWRGVAEYRAGRYQRAVAAFDGEQSILALYDLGTAYARLQEWSTAASVLEQVLRLDPNHADARHNLDVVLQAIELMNTSAGNPQQQPSANQSDAGQNAAEDSQDDSSQNQSDNGAGEATTAEHETDRKSDDSDAAGELSDEQPSRQPATAVASGEPPERGDEGERRINQSTLLETRESTQAAEILLRQIRDNPAKVLRARLHIAHRERRAVDQP
jgi:Ca-activated chloride channel family protein